MAQNLNFENRFKLNINADWDSKLNSKTTKLHKAEPDPFNNILKFDQDGELIIEFEDEIFNIEEQQLSTPIEDDFEYEILVDDSSSQR